MHLILFSPQLVLLHFMKAFSSLIKTPNACMTSKQAVWWIEKRFFSNKNGYFELRRDPAQSWTSRLSVALLLCTGQCLDRDSIFSLTSDGGHIAPSTFRSRGDRVLCAASSFIVELLHECRLDSLLSLIPPRLLLG
jgi:hypothetical protein